MKLLIYESTVELSFVVVVFSHLSQRKTCGRLFGNYDVDYVGVYWLNSCPPCAVTVIAHNHNNVFFHYDNVAVDVTLLF